MKNILLGITSSIAAYKAYELIRLYKKNGYNVKTIITENAKNFISPLVLETLTNNKVYFEQFEKEFKVEHISLAQWADVFVIAPISANTLSKIATGVADNLLTSVFCAYLGYKKPILIAPAMNEGMYNNPFVVENIEKLKKNDVEIVEPESGFLACNANGKGRLADIQLIYQKTSRMLYQDKKNNSKKVLVTLGGTKEKIDSVRFLTNASSGKMGTALADWAYNLGYSVEVISTIELKRNYPITKVDSALSMLEELKKKNFDYLFMAAAVGDFRMKEISEFKISKEDIDGEFQLNLVKNPDVVAEISKNKNENQKIIGFCLTDKDFLNCAKLKLQNKNLDYIVINEPSALNNDKNKVTILEKSGKITDIGLNTKENIAKEILEVVCD